MEDNGEGKPEVYGRST